MIQPFAPRKIAITDEIPTSVAMKRGGLERILVALAQHPNGLRLGQLGVRAKVSSASIGTFLSRGRKQGWIDGREHLTINAAGLAALGPFEPLPKGDELARYYLAQLGVGGAGRILGVLVKAYPRAFDPEPLREAAQVDIKSFSTFLSRLRTLELIEGKAQIKASPELFS